MKNERGATLIELLVYIAIFAVVLTLAISAYHQADVTSRGLSRNAAEIVRAVQAGEFWRREVRAAVGRPRLEAAGEGLAVLRLPLSGGEVLYHFKAGQVWRQDPSQAQPVIFLPEVKNSQFFAERRGEVDGWRWELELMSRRTNAAIKPRFTFLAPLSPASGRMPP
ncbi:MAG: prepilin-type N-terminal cleavage/methylation domain-containing protein [Verrucomicrobiales bacterium]|nr:prepilin-type N-terminal cleavage/methylation domain-containing protein [Verrucomicrobiales bacterium]